MPIPNENELTVLFNGILNCRDCHKVEPSVVPRLILDDWTSDLVIMAQAPSAVGVRVSGVHWFDTTGNLRPPGGTYMENYLNQIGFSIHPSSDLPRPYTTNAVQCWPGSNSQGRDRKPGSKEIALCSKWWIRELEALQPKALLLMGGVPATAFAKYVGLDLKFSDLLEKHQGVSLEFNGWDLPCFFVPQPVAPYTGPLGGRNAYYEHVFNLLGKVLN